MNLSQDFSVPFAVLFISIFSPCTPSPLLPFSFIQPPVFPTKNSRWKKGAGVITTSLPLSEPVSTELTGLFVEKPPENVVAVAGQKGRPANKHCVTDFPWGVTLDVFGHLLQEPTSPSSHGWILPPWPESPPWSGLRASGWTWAVRLASTCSSKRPTTATLRYPHLSNSQVLKPNSTFTKSNWVALNSTQRSTPTRWRS